MGACYLVNRRQDVWQGLLVNCVCFGQPEEFPPPPLLLHDLIDLEWPLPVLDCFKRLELHSVIAKQLSTGVVSAIS